MVGSSGDGVGIEGTVTWRELLAETEGRLLGGRFTAGDAEREARWIVEEASGFEGAELAAGLNEPATERGVARLDAMVARRLAGEPLQYVLGHWPFRTLDLLVDRRVLIPRPETEQVVEHALRELDARPAAGLLDHRRAGVQPADGDPLRVADPCGPGVGGGSGPQRPVHADDEREQLRRQTAVDARGETGRRVAEHRRDVRPQRSGHLRGWRQLPARRHGPSVPDRLGRVTGPTGRR